jgi:hypothetical protein
VLERMTTGGLERGRLQYSRPAGTPIHACQPGKSSSRRRSPAAMDSVGRCWFKPDSPPVRPRVAVCSAPSGAVLRSL